MNKMVLPWLSVREDKNSVHTASWLCRQRSLRAEQCAMPPLVLSFSSDSDLISLTMNIFWGVRVLKSGPYRPKSRCVTLAHWAAEDVTGLQVETLRFLSPREVQLPCWSRNFSLRRDAHGLRMLSWAALEFTFCSRSDTFTASLLHTNLF